MRKLGYLAVAFGLMTAAACSSAEPASKTTDSSGNKKHNETPTTPVDPTTPVTPAPVPAPLPDAGAPVIQSRDGIRNGTETDIDCGGSAAPKCDENKSCATGADCVSNECSGGRCKPPAVPTHYCQQLPSCCSKLASGYEQIACAGIQLAGKEGACQAELLLCGAGGIGGTSCGNLTKCCDQIQADGYDDDAYDCRTHNNGNASSCDSWLSQYTNWGWCSP